MVFVVTCHFGALVFLVHFLVECESTSKRECYGTSNGLNILHVMDNMPYISALKARYEGCTKLVGNLELTHLTKAKLSAANLLTIDFLSELTEVTGYILIFNVALDALNLNNLAFIYGRGRFTPTVDESTDALGLGKRRFSLLIMDTRIQNLSMRSLKRIRGHVGLIGNTKLCHWQTVNFRQLLGGQFKKKLLTAHSFSACNKSKSDSMDLCHGCSHCFGSSSEDCQQIFYKRCPSTRTCPSKLCFNDTTSMACCHKECWAGCFGTSDSECYGCKRFKNELSCVNKCPKGNFGYNGLCVTKCPATTVRFRGRCRKKCPPRFSPNERRICRKCPNGEKSCDRIKSCKIEEELTSRNIEQFRDCRKIDGFITITAHSLKAGRGWTDDGQSFEKKRLTSDDLELLSNVRVVSDFILIQTQNEDIKNLHFLRNLKRIEGQKFAPVGREYVLIIAQNHNLVDADLPNLQSITKGRVNISGNKHLCLTHVEKWKLIAEGSDRTVIEHNNNSCSS